MKLSTSSRRILAMGLRAFARASVASLLLTAGTACSDFDADDGPAASASVRDSAGIRIVEHPPGPYTDTVAERPALTVGREGEPDYELYRVRTVVALGSGNVVVANGGTGELRFYGPDGTHVRSVGGKGDGPSEFGFLSTVWVRDGDTLAVRDARRRRVVYFDSAGTFVRGDSYAPDLTLSKPEGSGNAMCFFPGILGVLGDGARVVNGWGCTLLEGRDGFRPTRARIHVARSDGRDTLRVFDTQRIWERGSPETPREVYALPPFMGAFRYAVGVRHIYLSEGKRYEVEAYDGEGRLATVLREDTVPPEVTPADRDRFIADRAEGPRPHPADVPFPERFGAYDALILSHEGELWARRYPRPGEESRRWTVFSADGERVRRVILPDFDAEFVRAGTMYGLRTNDLGVQRVVSYRVAG